MIIIFVILHSLRILTSVGELYILTQPNRHEFVLELGYGVPMWLHAVVLIGELCTVMNACLNIIIYKYIIYIICLFLKVKNITKNPSITVRRRKLRSQEAKLIFISPKFD